MSKSPRKKPSLKVPSVCTHTGRCRGDEKLSLKAPVARDKVRKALYHSDSENSGNGASRVSEACVAFYRADSPEHYFSFGRMVTRSVSVERVFSALRRSADSNAPVLLSGETGTGKELAARALHELGLRRSQQFIVINCGSLTPTLIESELFGHEKGAFTGAVSCRAGVFESADGGTLFLDEIGELPLELQPRLLRVLDNGEVRRVGSNAPFHVDVRVVASTNRNLAEAVREGLFRDDLYFRLRVIEVTIPPLRERFDDFKLLVDDILEEVCSSAGLSPKAKALLKSHDWPGNVRELKNVLTRAVLFSDGNEITADAIDIPELRKRTIRKLEEVEKEHILGVLRHCGGNRSEAAQRLGMCRSTLFDRLNRYLVATDRPIA